MAESAQRSPDLAAVDELCQLLLVAGRLGCRVRLFDVPTELRGLLELAGVDRRMLGPADDRTGLP